MHARLFAACRQDCVQHAGRIACSMQAGWGAACRQDGRMAHSHSKSVHLAQSRFSRNGVEGAGACSPGLAEMGAAG